MGTSAVSLHDVSVWTGERKVLIEDVTWTVQPGERWVVIGPNGAGKTTLMSVVGGDRFPSSGEAMVLGETFGKTDMRALRARIGRVDPNQRMLDWVNAEEAVLTGLKNQVWPKWDEWTPDDYTRARELLALVGCADFAEQEIKLLSQGERQRIRIARALIANPELMLLDEPTTGLDFPGREALLATIDDLTTTHPALPMVIVSHHLEELPSSITHVMLMKGGARARAGAGSGDADQRLDLGMLRLPDRGAGLQRAVVGAGRGRVDGQHEAACALGGRSGCRRSLGRRRVGTILERPASRGGRYSPVRCAATPGRVRGGRPLIGWLDQGAERGGRGWALRHRDRRR